MSAALGSPAMAARVSAVSARIGLDKGGVIAEENLAVEAADLDADDSVTLGQRPELLAELPDASVTRAVDGEVVGSKLAVDEELDQGGVAVHDSADRRVGEMRGRDRHEGAGGHADEHEHHAEDEREEHRSPPIAAGHSVAQHVRGP